MEKSTQNNLKVAVYLANLPLAKSFDVGLDGIAIEKRLLTQILPAEAQAIKRAVALGATEIVAVAVGSQMPKEILQAALAFGATSAIQIGANDWPLEPTPKMLGEALKEVVAEFDLLFLADLGSSIKGSELPVACGFALNWQSLTSVYKMSLQGSTLQVSRKLEKGKRQDLSLPLPAVLAFLPEEAEVEPPSVAAKIEALGGEILEYPLSYSLLCRKVSGASLHTEYWQNAKLAPDTKIIWQPDSALAGGQRLNAMVQGGIEVRHGEKISGSPKECAEGIIRFLLKQGIIIERV